MGIILAFTKSQYGEENPAQQDEPYAEHCWTTENFGEPKLVNDAQKYQA